jgi:hypothetical protein
LGFYLWEGKNANSSNWQDATGCDIFFAKDCEYRYTDISCYVSKDGDTAIRMLRTEAQKLQAELGDTVNWFNPVGDLAGGGFAREIFNFTSEGTYTYRTKATIMLDGNMVTPEQAAAEWEAKKENSVLWAAFDGLDFQVTSTIVFHPNTTQHAQYCIRPKALKQVKWEDVPVGVAVKCKAISGLFTFQGLRLGVPKNCLITENATAFFPSTSSIELAPANEQPWIALQDSDDMNEIFLKANTAGLTISIHKSEEKYKITGTHQGWKL